MGESVDEIQTVLTTRGPRRPYGLTAALAVALAGLTALTLALGPRPPEPQVGAEGAAALLLEDAPEGAGDPAPWLPLLGLRTPGLVQRVDRLGLRAGETLGASLFARGVADDDVRGALESLRGALDFRRLHAGDLLTLRFDQADGLVSLDVQRGPLEQVHAERGSDGRWQGHKVAVQVETVLAHVVGQVHTSLWDALLAAGEDGRLVAELVDIFAYDIDFYSEVRPADAFCLLVEKRYVNGHFIGYGDVAAAEFIAGGVPHRAFSFAVEGGRVNYFDERGHALRKQLLKAPLKYAPVTSGFGVRRHPILGYTRAHNGIDYGVPIGTPVWAVGDGRVVTAGWGSGYGRLVEISHPNGWLSQYAHLSRILVRYGQRVQQRDVIGLVGMTGLATGPHLHYGLKKNGRYVNALRQKFERSEPLAGAELAAYSQQVGKWLEELDKMRPSPAPAVGAAPP